MTSNLRSEISAMPKEKAKQAPIYDDFGLGVKVYMRRNYLKKKRGSKGNKEAIDAAKAMGIDLDDYRGIERKKSGMTNEEGKRIREILNDVDKVEKLAVFLEVEFDSLYHWIENSQKKVRKILKNSCSEVKEKVESNIIAEAQAQARKNLTEQYCNLFQKDKLDDHVLLALNNIEKYAPQFSKLPSLPQPLFIVLNALLENPKHIKDLDKITVFTGFEENMCDYLENCPQFASFLFYAANKIFYSDSQKGSYRECFKPMTVERLTTLLYVMVNKVGLYEFAQDLKPLQKFHEFHSLGMMMAKLLKAHLPLNVDYDVLQKGLALQGIGTYILYIVLSPSMGEEDAQKLIINKRKHMFYNLEDNVLDMVNYHYHPIISAILAANWGYDEAVIKLLLSHHDSDVNKVMPECAALKLINRFVDEDFRVATREDVAKKLDDYPQLDIPLEPVFNSVCEMDKLKDEMIRASSSMIDVRSRQASQVTNDKIKTFTDKNIEVRQGGVVKIFPGYNSTDFRFEPEYLTALTNECYYLLNALNERITTKREDETYDQFGKRMTYMQLALDVINHSFDVVAKKADMSVEDLKKMLKKIE
ncbi:MAG: hypothetical protein ABII18_05615 [bacterium]